MASYLSDNDDLRFYVERGIDWDALSAVTERAFGPSAGFESPAAARASYQEMAALFGTLAAERVGPQALRIDREDNTVVAGEAVMGAAMSEIFAAFKELELHRLCLPRELGGMNAPLTLYFLAGELLARGDVSVMSHFSFHGGIAMALLVYSLEEGSTEVDAQGFITHTRFAEEISDIISGASWGCMDITEPNAGSDMAALTTRAEQDSTGQWLVSGEKIFITSGHAKYHLVIARTEPAAAAGDDFAGLKGLSMFLVKAYEDGPDGKRTRLVALDRIEEKLGQHGAVTAALSFDRAPAKLIGRRGEGFRAMLLLMNNARIGVGFEGIGLAEAAFRMARSYAAERRSMGKTIDQHEMIADALDEMRTDIEGLRALAVASAFHEEMSHKLAILAKYLPPADEAARTQQARELARHRATSRRFTPLLKYLAAEKAVEIARRNVQIHGGMGYMRETGAEKLLRDALVLPIYEGTSQIQSLMAMKDTLGGIIKSPGAFMKRIADARWRSTTARDELERRVAAIQVSSLAVQRFLISQTAGDKLKTLRKIPLKSWRSAIAGQWDPKRDFATAMLHAERLTRILADEAISELLLRQAQRFPERRELLERWLARCEPRVKALQHEITETGGRILLGLSANSGA